jgi:hypothetical protein
MFSLYGEIDLNNISKIAQEMRVQGLESLGKMHGDNDHDKDENKDTY